MSITLEQARTFCAVADFGSYAKAAEKLGKQHTGVVYTLKTLEEQTGLRLLDRSQYRTTITPVGQRLLEQCRRLLEVERDIQALCSDLSAGWEPYLRVVIDGLVPFEPVLHAIETLSRKKVPTRVQVFTDFHRGVEESFTSRDAELMISFIAPSRSDLDAVLLPPIRAFLVAKKGHPLVETRRKNSVADLARHTLVTVRGSDPRLNLATSTLDQSSTFHLSDFNSKRIAILDGAGFGWLPEYLIGKELKRGTLKVIRWEKPSEHLFTPRLYHRGQSHLGRAAKLFLAEYLGQK